jgi:hypothetical protein
MKNLALPHIDVNGLKHADMQWPKNKEEEDV